VRADTKSVKRKNTKEKKDEKDDEKETSSDSHLKNVDKDDTELAPYKATSNKRFSDDVSNDRVKS